MGFRDIVKYVVACSGILKPIIAKWECLLLIATLIKATSSFFLHIEYVHVQYNLCQRPPVQKDHAVILYFQLNSNVYSSNTATPLTKMFVCRQCTVNETTVACNLFILKPNPTIVYLHTYVGPMNPIYVTYYTHGCFGIWISSKGTHVDISVAEALVHGSILIK